MWKQSASKPYSMDRNLWHISYEAGILEDPWFDPTTPDNREMYKLTVDPELLRMSLNISNSISNKATASQSIALPAPHLRLLRNSTKPRVGMGSDESTSLKTASWV